MDQYAGGQHVSDQIHQAKAVRVQSSAIVFAAVITTCGAVTSAIIQSRWPVTSIPLTGTPPTSNYAAANSEGESVMQPLPAISLAAAANTPASLSGSAHYEPHAPAAEL